MDFFLIIIICLLDFHATWCNSKIFGSVVVKLGTKPQKKHNKSDFNASAQPCLISFRRWTRSDRLWHARFIVCIFQISSHVLLLTFPFPD